MAKYSNIGKDNFDITKAELKEFEEALKKEEFRKLLSDYVEEVTDPQNREIYEKEMIQLEKERGVDITFMHPKPGYVIKTSVDGEQKAFINICSNEKIDKPIAVKRVQDGMSGNDWSIPYLLSPPKVDLDKRKQRCVVFDVLFHPLTLQLAKTNNSFRNLVNDTAISGVEDSFKAKLDRNNVKFPKIDFKGSKTASVVRKLRKDGPATNRDELLNIPNYPYKPPADDKKPTVTKPRKCSYGSNQNLHNSYTTPKYIIKQRKGIEYYEFLNSPDAKMNSAIPSELVVEVDLPLLSSAGDAVLDVCTRRLTLLSENPAKYKLDIKLPYDVDEANGSAKFDKRTKKLIVNLPVVKKALDLSYLSRDDSGIESDPNQNRSSSDEDLSSPTIEVLSSCDKTMESESDTNRLRTSAEVCGEFLSSQLHYSFPPFSVYNNGNSVSVTINVKNIDPTTVSHQYIFLCSGVHFKFTSLGSGHFPIHYTYCIQFPTFLINTTTLKVDVWDNNLTINMDLISGTNAFISSCLVGPDTTSLHKRDITATFTQNVQDNLLGKFEDIEEEDGEEKEVNHNKTLAVTVERTSPLLESNVNPMLSVNKEDNDYKIEEIDSDENLCNKIASIELQTSNCQINKKKLRTASESNAHPPCLATFSRRSILKTSRSLSESNTDEYNTWSSLDSSDNTEDAIGSVVKKTVRFSDVISKKVFRANSSILGQKHKNEKKSRNRKKMARRRLSESETSEVSDFSDYSELSEASEASEASDVSSDDQSGGSSNPPPQLSCGKRHRRRGSKNSRKNAATAKQNSFILSQD